MDIVDFLRDLPSAAVYAAFMTAGAVLAALSCRLVAPLVGTPPTKEMLDVAMRTTAAVTAALTLTLAFCAVQARSQMTDAQRSVHAEAAAIGGLLRLADRLGEPAHGLAPAIAAYLRSITEQEFPAMAAIGRHPATQHLAEAVEAAAHAVAVATAGSLAADMLKEADEVETAREERLQAAAVALPREFWVLILLLAGLVLASGTLYPPRAHVVAMLAIQAAGLGALVAFVFLIEQPFRGEMIVSTEPYRTLARGVAHRLDRGGVLAPGAAAP